MNKFNYITEVKVDTLPSGRTYHTPSGSFPSITTVLGKTSPNLFWLNNWKDRVGEEEAARISKKATDRGTLVHSYVEKHYDKIEYDLYNESSDVKNMVKALINGVDTGIQEIWGQEQVLWSEKYKYAGRTDMVGVWKNYPAIIDFKTSEKKKAEKSIRDYFIQCCAYAVAHNEMYKTGIKHGVIIIALPTGEYQLFEKNLPPFIHDLRSRRSTYDKLV